MLQTCRLTRLWFPLLVFGLLLLVTKIPRPVSAEDEHWAAHGDEGDGEDHHEEHHDEGDEGEWEYVDDDDVGSDDEEEEDLYFYAHHEEPIPIHEFELPEGADPFEQYPMLWKEPPPGVHRIVEFYAHWCPHCLHFKPQYISFAEKFQEILAQQYEDVKVEVYAISCVPYRPLCRHYGVRSYPKVKLLLAGETNGTLIEHSSLHPFHLLKQIGVDVSAEDEEEAALSLAAPVASSAETADADNSPDGQHPAEDFWLPRSKKEVFQDAHRSFHFAMENGIFVGQGPMTNSTKDHLESFLLLIQATLPPTLMGDMHSLVDALLADFETTIASEDTWMGILDQFPPPKKKWSHSCTRGQQGMGYTCGLWQLFHIMSMGLVEWNNLVMVDDYPYYRPEETAEILRHFIENFFGCEVCRVHFLKAFDDCEYDRCNRLIKDVGGMSDWIEFPLWLFEFHNGVNQRLMKERSKRERWKPTDGDMQVAQWPSRTECPMCWHQDGRWDPDNTYMFLRLTYWPSDRQAKTMKEKLLGSPLNVPHVAAPRGRQLSGGDSNLPYFVGGLGALAVLVVGFAAVYRFYQKHMVKGQSKKNT